MFPSELFGVPGQAVGGTAGGCTQGDFLGLRPDLPRMPGGARSAMCLRMALSVYAEAFMVLTFLMRLTMSSMVMVGSSAQRPR